MSQLRHDLMRKNVKRILLDPEGRAALKEFGIDVQIDDDTRPKDKPIVAVLCPTYRATEPRMQDGLAAMVNYTRKKDFAVVYGGPPLSASVVHWSRNGLIQQQLISGKPWTHILFIDDDIVVAPDALEKLLSHKKDIVAGVCTRRIDPPVPNIRVFSEESGNYDQIWSWTEGATLMEVGAVGTGLMLISQHALEQVGQAYFDCMWEQEFYGMAGEKLETLKAARLKHFDDTKLAYWFRFLPAMKVPVEYGEDISFCHMARRYCQIPIYVDMSVQPEHLGMYGYGIRDFLPHQKSAARRAKAEMLAKKREQEPVVEGGKISVLIPTRENTAALCKSIDRLRATAKDLHQIEILVMIDNDDPQSPDSYRVATGKKVDIHVCPRYGYRNLHKYYNRLAALAKGDWLMLWNDDSIMEEPDWDEKIRNAGQGMKVINMTGDMNLFPVIHRSMHDTVGHISLQTHSDTWWQAISRETLTEQYIPMKITHERKELREEYSVTSPEFFSEKFQRLLLKDIEKVMEALQKPKEEAVAVG